MRVLHVITALGVGGAEHMLLRLIGTRAMSALDQQVVTLLPGGPLAAPLRERGVPVRELNLMGGMPVLGGCVRLALLARRWGPDLVQGWLYHGNLGAWVAQRALLGRVPLVWGIRQSLPSLVGENRYARAAIRLNRLLSGQPDTLIFNAGIAIEQHRRLGFDVRRAQHLPNGFDTAAFAPDAAARARLRAEWCCAEDNVVFGLLARYHPVKDHAGFLSAARLVLQRQPAARFVLAGTGIDTGNEELAHALAASGMSDHVLLLGERRDIPAILSALDVVVSASRAEALSNTVGEAMSCARPCIVTAVGDMDALVGDGGLVVPPGDTEALAAAMLDLIDRGRPVREALGATARRRVIEQFGLEAQASRQVELYRALVQRSGGR
jgi:glycosyltransferase involved in cell wall biosynthesis